MKMESLSMFLRHADELYPLLKLKFAINKAHNHITEDPHLAFCYSILNKVSKTYPLIINQLGTELRDTACVFYLTLRALDTVEDDESIPKEIKAQTLTDFHCHIYNPNWKFSCGTKQFKILMEQFHHVSAVFLALDKRYQEAIEYTIKIVGAGMAKFISKEVETIDEYDEYCHYAGGAIGLGMSKIFLASQLEVLTPDWKKISNSTGLLLEKTHIIKSYLEDINEIPRERLFWPREIWGKYVENLEDFKYEENSRKAVQCLSDMVTNALIHVEDCMKYLASFRDPALFQSCAIPQIVDFGTIALHYNNAQVFRSVVKLRRSLVAKIFDRTKTMNDAYGFFYDFSCIMKAKVEKNDTNANKILNRLDAIQKVCIDNGVLHKRISYVNDESKSSSRFVSFMLQNVMLLLLLVTVFVYLKEKPNDGIFTNVGKSMIH